MIDAAPQTALPLEDLRAVHRRLAEPPPRRGSAWGMLGAGALAAASGLALCVAVFLSAGDLPSARPPAPAVAPLFTAAHA